MKQHFNSVFQNFSYKIYQFGKIRTFLNLETRILVYKQTVLPLTEYVSFVMTLNNKHEVEKLQKLQNKALRMCYNIQNPRDVSVSMLHEMANVDMLYTRRMLQLMCIMYSNRWQLMHERIVLRNTRLADKYIFEISRANLGLYSKNIGGTFWNELPRHIQDLNTKESFKRAVMNLL